MNEWIDRIGILIIEAHDRFRPGCASRVEAVMRQHGYRHEIIGENDIYRRQ